jgi:hypothetical protein
LDFLYRFMIRTASTKADRGGSLHVDGSISYGADDDQFVRAAEGRKQRDVDSSGCQ